MFNGHCRVLTIDADRSFEEVCAQYEQNLHLLLASEQPLEEQRFSPGASDALPVSSPGGARVQTPQSAAGKSAALPPLRGAFELCALTRCAIFRKSRRLAGFILYEYSRLVCAQIRL